jgi:diaminopimelate decarboxylase
VHEHHRLRGQGSARSRPQARIDDIRYAGDTGGDRAGRQGSARTDDTQSRTHTVTGFGYANGELCAEDVPLSSIAARFGTPCFVYSRAALEGAWRAFDGAFSGVDHLVCYALKANSNLGVLNLFARLGSGFDIVSGGELERALAAQGDPRKIVFSGVGKSEAEIEAGLARDILCFNVESASELETIASIAARMEKRAPVSLRVNPDVDPRTHPYISTGLKESKFGIPFVDAHALYRRAASLPNVRVTGIDMHIGSQITELAPYRDAARRMLELVDRLQAEGIALSHIDMGGGLGIRYRDETPIALDEYAAMLVQLMRGRPQTLLLEPGRWLVGDAGVLLARVRYLKPGGPVGFAVIDAAMNDLLRPALYDAWHAVDAVRPRNEPARAWDIVGPVCESADFLARGRTLALAEGDLIALRSAGAYAMAMSSNYNSRPRAAEVIVDGRAAHLVRRRESTSELFAHEAIVP